MKQYYRVELQPLERQHIYDTKNKNYGNSIEFDYYDHFLNTYDRIIEQINLPVDFLVSVNNHIYTTGGAYVDQIENAIDFHGDVDAFSLSGNINHKGYKIPVDLMNDFLQSFDEYNQFVFFDNGTVLWEYYLEKVRAAEFPQLPSRLQSTFFFESVPSCEYYKINHLNKFGQIYEVSLEETQKRFEGDMKLIDKVENSIPYQDLIESFRKYWRGEKTVDPVIETVFQGKFKWYATENHE